MINLVVPPVDKTAFIGNIAYGRLAKTKLSDLGLPHPENTVAWELQALEMLGNVSTALGFKANKRESLDFAALFRDTNGGEHEAGGQVAQRFLERLIEVSREFSTETSVHEDYDLEMSSAEIKKAFQAFTKGLAQVETQRGHLVLFHKAHQALIDEEAWEIENEYDAIVLIWGHVTNYGANPITEMVAVMKEAHKEIVGWSREIRKQIGALEYVEALIDDGSEA